MEGIDGGEILVLCAVFGGHCTLLLKFTQIIEIVNAVAHIVNARLTLVGRGQPYIGDAQPRQISGGLSCPPPMSAVLRQIPLK